MIPILRQLAITQVKPSLKKWLKLNPLFGATKCLLNSCDVPSSMNGLTHSLPLAASFFTRSNEYPTDSLFRGKNVLRWSSLHLDSVHIAIQNNAWTSYWLFDAEFYLRRDRISFAVVDVLSLNQVENVNAALCEEREHFECHLTLPSQNLLRPKNGREPADTYKSVWRLLLVFLSSKKWDIVFCPFRICLSFFLTKVFLNFPPRPVVLWSIQNTRWSPFEISTYRSFYVAVVYQLSWL